MSDYQSPPMSPSNMIDDRPVSMDLIAIEATMDEMRSQHEATHQRLSMSLNDSPTLRLCP